MTGSDGLSVKARDLQLHRQTWNINKSAQQVYKTPHTLKWPNSADSILGIKYIFMALTTMGVSVHPAPCVFQAKSSRTFSSSWPCNSSYTAVVWARLSSVWPIGTCCRTWSSTTSPNQNFVDFFQHPTPTPNQNQEAEKGKQ